MGKLLPSKMRWKRLPNDSGATCYSAQCASLTRHYCRQCKEPYCRACKGDHILRIHTLKRFASIIDERPRLRGYDELPDARKIEILALMAKVRRMREVEQSGAGQIDDETFVAWAVVANELVEKRDVRIEQALQDLYAELKGRRAIVRDRVPAGVR